LYHGRSSELGAWGYKSGQAWRQAKSGAAQAWKRQPHLSVKRCYLSESPTCRCGARATDRHCALMVGYPSLTKTLTDVSVVCRSVVTKCLEQAETAREGSWTPFNISGSKSPIGQGIEAGPEPYIFAHKYIHARSYPTFDSRARGWRPDT
jgi:hypothetical protein